jgi:hypothetical protein
MKFCCVNILQSESSPAHFHAGPTDKLKDRPRRRHSRAVLRAASFKAWRVKTAAAFTDREHASAVGRYLKSASGRAFATKRR